MPTKTFHLKRDEGKSPTNPQHRRAVKRSYHEEWETPLFAMQNDLGNRQVVRLLAARDGNIAQMLTPHPLGRQGLATQTVATGAVQREGEAAKPSDGEVKIENVQFTYYDVEGSTLAEVGRQLDPDEWGRCRYDVDYSFETTADKTTKIDITLRLTVRLPRWSGEGWDKASPKAKAEWRRMMTALEAHEEKHAEIARTWAPIFKTTLLGKPQGKLAELYAGTRKKLDDATEKFDKQTQHGQAEGVTLDLSIP